MKVYTDKGGWWRKNRGPPNHIEKTCGCERKTKILTKDRNTEGKIPDPTKIENVSVVKDTSERVYRHVKG